MPRCEREATTEAVAGEPPRILVVADEQWPRALLRAELCEAGYDAVGATTLSQALGHLAAVGDRGPGRVRAMIVDAAVAAAEPGAVAEIRQRYPGVPLALIYGSGAVPPGPWAATLRRPITIGDIVAAVGRLLPSESGRYS